MELFGGIGAIRKACIVSNISHQVIDYVEIDKYAVKSYNQIYNTNYKSQSVVGYQLPNEAIDILMHGSPCQDFSNAGKRLGGSKDSGTRSSLLFETIRIIKAAPIKPKWVIWENVKGVLEHNMVSTFYQYLSEMKELGYQTIYKVLNAKDYGIPQNRERVFAVSYFGVNTFKFPQKKDLKVSLKDMLDDEVDEKYYLSEKQIEKFKKSTYKIERTRLQEKLWVDTLCSVDYKRPKVIQVGSISMGGKWINEQCGQVYNTNGLASTLNCVTGGHHEPKIVCPNNSKSMIIYEDTNQEYEKASADYSIGLRIRKLTAKEYWKLMGFSVADYEKAAQVNSETQLYKQAGNSIVVNVLSKILEVIVEIEKYDNCRI